MDYKELDTTTRKYMLQEFSKEENGGNPYRSPRLNTTGRSKFHSIMEDAIKNGNEKTLAKNLQDPNFWNEKESARRKDTFYEKKIDPISAAALLAQTEFNTWYTTGLAKRLIDEEIDECEIYRAELAKQPRCECSKLEGKTVKVSDIYGGHRAKYHPKFNAAAFSIPSGPFCHHTIKRIGK